MLHLIGSTSFGCVKEMTSRWNFSRQEVVESFGVDLKNTSAILRDGNNGWIDLSGSQETRQFFDAYNVAVHGVFSGDVFTPEHFVVRPIHKFHLETYEIRAAFESSTADKDWKLSYDRTLKKNSDWLAAKFSHENFQLQKAYPFPPRTTTFILVPQTVYPPFSYSQLLMRSFANSSATPPRRVLVMGSGGGYDALGVAFAFPDCQVVGVDNSTAAIQVARKNAQLHGVQDRVTFHYSDLFENVEGKFDAVLFVVPRAVKADKAQGNAARFSDTTHFDLDGVILRRFLQNVPKHLSPSASAFVMADSQFQTEFAADIPMNVGPISSPERWTANDSDDGTFQIFQITFPTKF